MNESLHDSPSNHGRNDPLAILDEDDQGDDMQRRVRYQACVAAGYALSLLQDDCEYIAVYCEHHDDFLLVKRDGNITAFQVKTRAESRTPLRANDEGVQSALVRFVLKDNEYPGRFEKFVIYTNSGFWKERKDRYNLVYLLEAIRRQDDGAVLANNHWCASRC